MECERRKVGEEKGVEKGGKKEKERDLPVGRTLIDCLIERVIDSRNHYSFYGFGFSRKFVSL